VSGHSGQSGLKWPLRITSERSGGVLVLAAAGRLGYASADRLKAALDLAIAQERGGVVLDFSQVDYLSSAGLQAIDAAAVRLAALRGTLVLCAVPEPVRIALELAGCIPRIALEPSRDRAVARIASPPTDAID
jgi:anti-anti-sigma factor